MKNNTGEFRIKRLALDELHLFKELITVFQTVFETEANQLSDLYLQSILAKPGFVAFVSMHNNTVIGGLTAFELPLYYFEASELFIYDVGILQNFQRKGLGKHLIEKVKEYCREKNISTMFVPAHEEDENALDFYRSTGGQAEKVVHFNYKAIE